MKRLEKIYHMQIKIRKKFYWSTDGSNYLLNMLLPKRYEKQCEYLLRVKSDDIDIYRNYKFCNTKRSQDFFTVTYF